ncbi:MAG TPA: alpha/beta hydrolase [Candidatus Binataceae bacterium]|nr:alpha/beta hydrolase [Candidatus Binataceae bacterium]
MAFFERGGASIYYEEHGSGYPVLLLAPGGVRSSVGFWKVTPNGQKNPIDPTLELAGDFRLIAMDQRNAGKSRAPVSPSDGWQTYAEDQLALLDHLGITRCHIMGQCIGCSFCFELIKVAPSRVSAAVLAQPIGLSPENRDSWRAGFDQWAKSLKQERPELDDRALEKYRENLFASDFVFNVSRDFVKTVQTPLLLLYGNDAPHPRPVSEEIAKLAPNIAVVEDWKTPEVAPAAVARIREFLKKHRP